VQQKPRAVDLPDVRASILLCLTACNPFNLPPVEDGASGSTVDLGGDSRPWSTIDTFPDGGGNTPTTPGPPPGPQTPTAGDTGATGTPGTGATDDAGLGWLRLTELLPDPEGKDGGSGSPEFVEIQNVGPSTVALSAFCLRGRSWPALDAEDLGISHLALAPGQLLVVERYAEAADLPPGLPLVEGELIHAAFSTGSGLRNADGAVLLGNGDDLVTYGAVQPAPYDDPTAWSGEPATAPGGGESLCRVDSTVDTNRASDWELCSPSPGRVPESPDDGASGTDGSTTTTASTSTSASTESTSSQSSTTHASGSATTGQDTSTETVSASTTISSESSATTTDFDTATTSNGGLGAPRVVIVEVLANPPGPSSNEKYLEYVELLNIGNAAVDLAGWTVLDDVAPQAPGADPLLHLSGDGGCAPLTCLAPGHRALVVGNAYSGPSGQALVLATDDTTIADGGLTTSEPVVIRDDSGAVVSTYRDWDDPKADPYPLYDEVPVVRVDAAGPDEPTNWCFGTASPGE
jgi:hypothetical protein